MNAPRYWTSTSSGTVHRTVRWSQCSAWFYNGRGDYPVRDSIGPGPRCAICFPPTEVPYGRKRTGWPRGFHPMPVVDR